MLKDQSFPPITLSGGGVVELRRCEDDFYRKARALSIPIEIRSSRLITLTDRLGLPQIYAALTVLTGPSGDLHDCWKGSFSFSFKLTVRRDSNEFRYLLRLVNFRSLVEPTLYRLQKPSESHSRTSYHAPFDNELSTNDIIDVVEFIAGFLEGFLETMPMWTTPFVKEVQSNFILFGYDPKAGAFFEESYDDEKSYRAALEHWRTLIPKETTEREQLDRDW
ncbi:hypothetical protein [Archangium violaceum]|uniref:Uncharacterized protein n=1 Tax=Archangium violaceum Cb vi76 TaxID=1406225 RepID=A0A084SNG8_9BACT|nr:hypothetical protein [Archangium violaceum]KFA90003.1 hypothetical protein Q664_30930 [Archangium violaceum Cb vi76]